MRRCAESASLLPGKDICTCRAGTVTRLCPYLIFLHGEWLIRLLFPDRCLVILSNISVMTAKADHLLTSIPHLSRSLATIIPLGLDSLLLLCIVCYAWRCVETLKKWKQKSLECFPILALESVSFQGPLLEMVRSLCCLTHLVPFHSCLFRISLSEYISNKVVDTPLGWQWSS